MAGKRGASPVPGCGGADQVARGRGQPSEVRGRHRDLRRRSSFLRPTPAALRRLLSGVPDKQTPAARGDEKRQPAGIQNPHLSVAPGDETLAADRRFRPRFHRLLPFDTCDNRLKLAGVKRFLDGAPWVKTALCTQPLLTGGPSGGADHVGFPLRGGDEGGGRIRRQEHPDLYPCQWRRGHGHGGRRHAHGRDRAGDDRRDVVLHSPFMRSDHLEADLEPGLTPSFFTCHTFFRGDVHIENTGMKRAAFISPMGSPQCRHRFSNHSDFWVTPMAPMLMMKTAIRRKTRWAGGRASPPGLTPTGRSSSPRWRPAGCGRTR